LGISVNRKREAGGIDIKKLNAIADALSVKLDIFNWRKKYCNTSNNGTPLKPGNIIFLLFLIKKYIGGVVNIIRSSLVTIQCKLKILMGEIIISLKV
jgi:hypothetical protein